MAENEKQGSSKRASGSDGGSKDSPYVTTYVEDDAPKLPSQNVDVQRDAPVIDRRLVDARDAEAKAQAARVEG